MDFYDIYEGHKRFDFDDFFSDVTATDVQSALAGEKLTEQNFLALLSPAAEPFLEAMAHKARRLTVQNFGKVVFLFTPLYLSNYCENQCAYCGFNSKNEIMRKKLTKQEMATEAETIAAQDIKHILVLTGESREHTPPAYLNDCLGILNRHFSSISVEVYPLATEEYRALIAAGVDGLTVYQEVYNEKVYAKVHLAGPKRDYLYRLQAPERGCQAGMRTVTIGPLLGLDDWRREVFFAGVHAAYLQNKYWDAEVNLSFPRLRPHRGSFLPFAPVDDRAFVQLLLASRLFLPRAGLTVSTRESADFRDRLLRLGVTKMSAWSSTEVGGRKQGKRGSTQFEIADQRDIAEMKEMLLSSGYQPIFKDWHKV